MTRKTREALRLYLKREIGKMKLFFYFKLNFKLIQTMIKLFELGFQCMKDDKVEDRPSASDIVYQLFQIAGN